MSFLPKEAIDHHKSVSSYGGNPLRSVVAPFPPQLKQAMYAAAEKDLIARRTWNGCAFNAAGEVAGAGSSITSFGAAARLFDVPQAVVERFIRVWDNMKGSDQRCTGLLKAALLEAGLTEGMTVPERVKKIVRGYAYKSLETQFHEELANVESIADLPGMDQEKADAVQVLLNA